MTNATNPTQPLLVVSDTTPGLLESYRMSVSEYMKDNGGYEDSAWDRLRIIRDEMKYDDDPDGVAVWFCMDRDATQRQMDDYIKANPKIAELMELEE